MFDIITFGSATKDIFLRSKESVTLPGEEFATGEGICFSLGSKVKVEEIYFTSGGGGTNTAATFAKQGFNVAYCGKVGEDNAGEGVLKDLKHYGIDSSLVSYTKERPTNHSIVINIPEKDRTILVYRGAADLHEQKDINLESLKAKWFYLAPFSSHSKELFLDLIDFAVKKDIKVMVNPSKSQLRDERVKEKLRKVDILVLNMEEAATLTEIDFENEKEIIRAVKGFGKEVVLVTRGVEGVIAYSKGNYYQAKPIFPDATDRTGAGDSFGAGFLAEFMRSGDIEKSIQLAIANSTACLQKKGAKHGLLGKSDQFHMSPVEKKENL